MNFKQKLGYMCIGCLFTIAGYILASLGGGDTTHAQQKEQVIDKIVCRELEVVNKKGKRIIYMGDFVKDGGWMQIYNGEGYPIVTINPDLGSGRVSVRNKKGKTLVDIKDFYPLTGSGGSIELYNKHGLSDVQIVSQGSGGVVSVLQNKDHGKGGVFLSTSPRVFGGGYVAITDNNGNPVVRMYQNREHGIGGVVSILDQNKKSVIEMFVDEMGNGTIQTRKGVWRTH